MQRTYWIVKYNAKGNRKAMPLCSSLRPTRTASITACIYGFDETWADMKKRVDLDVVKVQLKEL